MKQAVRVFLVEDHPLTSAGILTVLRQDPGCTLVASARSCLQATESVAIVEADVAMLDISLPDGNGLDLIDPCLKKGLSVVMLSMHLEADLLFESFRRGALCYVSKLVEPASVINALRHAADGRTYVCGMSAEVFLDAERQRSRRLPYPELTRREAEVAVSIAAGIPTTDIASSLHVSAKTVDSHRLSIFRKLKVNSALQLARYTVAAQLT